MIPSNERRSRSGVGCIKILRNIHDNEIIKITLILLEFDMKIVVNRTYLNMQISYM